VNEMNKGDIVLIYEKPLSRIDPEGLAKLEKFISSDEETETWCVRFFDDNTVATRRIRKFNVLDAEKVRIIFEQFVIAHSQNPPGNPPSLNTTLKDFREDLQGPIMVYIEGTQALIDHLKHEAEVAKKTVQNCANRASLDRDLKKKKRS
jgi:hypothetical protein